MEEQPKPTGEQEAVEEKSTATEQPVVEKARYIEHPMSKWFADRINAEVELLEKKAEQTKDEEKKKKILELIERVKNRKSTMEEINMAKGKKTKAKSPAQKGVKNKTIKKKGGELYKTIEAALKAKLGSREKVINYCVKKLPKEKDDKRIKKHVLLILFYIRHKEGKWKSYKFNKDNFSIK